MPPVRQPEIYIPSQPYYYCSGPQMASDQTLIQAQKVSRQYRLGETLIYAVNEVSLDIQSGEFVALLGSSGSGKSTLLNLLAGLDRPTSGAIHVKDRDLAALDSVELARYRRDTVGMVFQSFNLLPRMTLEENVELPLRLAEVERGEREARVAESLERVRLGGRRKHRPTELSGGEQQRGALARALVNRPAILFADEPTGNLDSVNGEQILSLLKEIQGSLGMTIIMVTHERPLAERFANRIVVLSDGRLVSNGAQS
jgi:putative ABC transport system ATP-binding protein